MLDLYVVFDHWALTFTFNVTFRLLVWMLCPWQYILVLYIRYIPLSYYVLVVVPNLKNAFKN